MTDCLFCGIVAGDVPSEIVLSDDDTVAFRDIAPQAPTHVLVVPRRHVTDAASLGPDDGPLVVAMLATAKAVAEAEGFGGPERGYRLVFNVGPDAQNSVGHLHLHLLGGRQFGWPPG